MGLTQRRTGTTSRSVALAGGGVAVAAVLALAGCGSSSSDGGSAAPASPSPSSAAPSTAAPSPSGQAGGDGTALQTALTTTAHAESARMVLDETLQAGGKDVTVHGSGVTSLDDSASQARGEFTVVAAGQQVEMRVLGSTLYEKLPPSAGTKQLSGGKPWIKVDTTKIPHTVGDTSNQAPSASAQLAYLDHPQRVTKVGSERVGGVDTTHYRVSVSPKILATSGVDTSKPIPVDVWIDAQHRVRQEKLSAAVTLGGSAATSSGTSQKSLSMNMTLQLGDFGTAVHVSAPPAGQVTDATQRIVSAAKGGAATTS
ncbi:hypothetical protein GA0115240_151813 [Streptomyces sp. DvalAA-14]|uniref:hypothetical protein n=1 Tax=unclassified Streptomyces TaxID=2593676 RepID=UPI00081B6BF7|nr:MULTISPECIES: hypothetical protein [unclassified Streptomyces]MYS23321.1 hypothetical protein [Streptomyces sp. SID4948]SCE31496.1 hypothetical protein GA0115240_151813 [Streptomyces sp. DvalAA-14]